jgi:hypothetical protein
MEIGAELHRIEVPPAALGRLIVYLTSLSALGAAAASRVITHSDVHPQRLKIKVNTGDFPRGLKAE